MKKVKLVQAMFTQEEIAAINTKNIELEEENKALEEKYEKLKADYIKLSKIVEVGWGYRASYVNELRDKIAKLEQELKIWMLTAKDYARLQWVDLEDFPRL